MNMATEPSRDVPVVVHLRNLAHPEDVHSVIAQAYHLQGSEPVTTVELDYQSGSREWKETLRLREPGEFALEVVVKMKHPKGSTPEGTVFRAYPVLLTVP
jgi:hypothetical protein